MCTLQFFAMRSMASGAGFHRAYTNGTQQAFLEGHEHGFHYFGGVFHILRYDNLTSAVKRSCVDGSARKPNASSLSGRTGASAVSIARRGEATRRAA
jgi:transposase